MATRRAIQVLGLPTSCWQGTQDDEYLLQCGTWGEYLRALLKSRSGQTIDALAARPAAPPTTVGGDGQPPHFYFAREAQAGRQIPFGGKIEPGRSTPMMFAAAPFSAGRGR